MELIQQVFLFSLKRILDRSVDSKYIR